jgi:ammonium transporter Rh
MQICLVVAAVLISLGAVIGKITPLQLVIMAIIEICCHSFNYQVLMRGTMHLMDIGGTYIDHMFGAYFGLAVSFMLGKPRSEPEFGYNSDLFSLFGTLFLWVYWPSFVIGAADPDSAQQEYGMVNTILALASSTVCAFWLSSVFDENGRFRPIDVQNATLAGGVAIGCTANLTMSGFGAICIGATAGIVSVCGYNKLMPFLEHQLGIHDTCGVHNLHGMPSVIGGLASIIVAGFKGTGHAHDSAIYGRNNVNDQWWYQAVAILLCMSFAIFAGLVTGYILNLCSDPVSRQAKFFHDDQYWCVADDYGRSLYSELVNILDDSEVEVKKALQDAMPEWSAHSGRRYFFLIRCV